MHVYRDIQSLPSIKNAVITIGTFDGVHLGHRKIIDQLKKEAAAITGETVIVTFYPHPRKVVHKEQEPLLLLTTLSEKLHLLETCGVDHVVVVPFNEAFANQTAAAYVEDFLVGKLHPKVVIIGYDHKFGKDRRGDYTTLEHYGKLHDFKVIEIPEKVLNEVTISSTAIRTAIKAGDVSQALNLLGHPYTISGQVVKGNQLGRTIGYPTANIHVPESDKLLPAYGVYAVLVRMEGQKLAEGMLSIGIRPTIGESPMTIEVNIFDFNMDLYGRHLTIEFIERLRDELKFDGLEPLKAALAQDAIDTKQALARYRR